MRVPVKKKSHAGGIAAVVIIPIILLLLIGLPISLLGGALVLGVGGLVAAGGYGYYLMQDNNTEELNIDENFEMKTFGENLLYSSFDDAETTKKIQVVVTKDDINNLIYQAMHSFNLEQMTGGKVSNDILGKAYMTINGNDYHFYVDINAKINGTSLLKTRVHLTTVLYEKYSTNSFVFKIKDIAFGKVYGMKGLAKKAIMTFVKEEMITDFINKIGLSLKYDQSNLSISYNKDDIINDLAKMTGLANGSSMYMDVLQALVKQELIQFDFTTDNLIEGYVDLKKLQTNEFTTDDTEQLKVNSHSVVTDCKNKLLKLVNEDKVIPATTSQADLTSIFQFLFLGYEGTTDAVKSVVNPIDMSSIGITDKTAYKGFDLACNEQLLLNRMSSTINVQSLMHGGTDVCRLTEKDISDYVRGRSIVGYTTLITRVDKDGNLKLNFVTIDNFYCNLYQNAEGLSTVDFIVRINLNGCPTSLTFSTFIPSDGLKENTITFGVKNIKYGEMGGEDLTNMLFEIIASALDGGDSSISANKDNHTITFNFGDILRQAKESVEAEVHKIPGKGSWSGDAIFTGTNVNLEMFGTDKNDAGQFGISLKEPISL